MQRMVASSIPNNTVPTSTRAQTRAGGWIASFDFDGACTSTPSLPAIASPNESLHDSSTTTSTLTGPFCCNQQYSVTAITTAAGAIVERYACTAYGQPTILNASGLPLTPQSSTLSNRYSYTGREWDSTLGLHHFRARWMSPSTGRFLGRDPIGYEGSEWGLYEYVNSKVLQSADPSGLKCCLLVWLGTFPWDGHCALNCGPNSDRYPSRSDYYSCYPNGRHSESDDRKGGPPSKTVCMDCLDEAAIERKFSQMGGCRGWTLSRNCCSIVRELLLAGMVQPGDDCQGQAKKCPCWAPWEDCSNSCDLTERFGIIPKPGNTKNYFECLKRKNCNPWEFKCRTTEEITPPMPPGVF
jgi:RHS repeat-associated protein